MTFSHHFIDISQNILNLWMKLIFLETRHLRLQYEHKNKTIPIKIESDMIFQNWLYRLLQQLRENQILTCSSFPSIFPLNAPNFPLTAKMRSTFMIFCQPSLNGLSFIFPLPLLYKPSPSFISRHTKNSISSLLLSSSEVE